MLPALQYTDFHKFLVSVGGVLCGLAIAVPVLLLRSQSALNTSERQLAELTPAARRAVRAQQGQIAWLVHAWPYCSVLLLTAGLTFVVAGAVMWRRRQARVDDREAAELSKIQAEDSKTRQEVLMLLRESQEVAEPGDVDERPATVDTASEPLATVYREPVAATEPSPERSPYQMVGQSVVTAFAQAFAGRVDIVTNVRAGYLEVDAALLAKDARAFPNLVVNVTLVSRRNAADLRHRLHQALEWGAAVRGTMRTRFGADFRPVALLVFRQLRSGPTMSGNGQVGVDLGWAEQVVTAALGEGDHSLLPITVVLAVPEAITPAALREIEWATTHPRLAVLPAER